MKGYISITGLAISKETQTKIDACNSCASEGIAL